MALWRQNLRIARFVPLSLPEINTRCGYELHFETGIFGSRCQRRLRFIVATQHRGQIDLCKTAVDMSGCRWIDKSLGYEPNGKGKPHRYRRDKPSGDRSRSIARQPVDR
jgi:hypothetical protein